ncbi:hypothetical protein Nepgr_019155 [Nepenthes gracilis]|uniref:Uncharacterized protein n=1 Tax=Nepenthes gracilis TaxID=150966 RepID=A0AAD3SVC4_NEPGR|nr:hypothetical protein Nepgr_019155 [Nepenthes gracilis]
MNKITLGGTSFSVKFNNSSSSLLRSNSKRATADIANAMRKSRLERNQLCERQLSCAQLMDRFAGSSVTFSVPDPDGHRIRSGAVSPNVIYTVALCHRKIGVALACNVGFSHQSLSFQMVGSHGYDFRCSRSLYEEFKYLRATVLQLREDSRTKCFNPLANVPCGSERGTLVANVPCRSGPGTMSIPEAVFIKELKQIIDEDVNNENVVRLVLVTESFPLLASPELILEWQKRLLVVLTGQVALDVGLLYMC